jgi:N-acetyl-anhydromuramyl-L-alanine amidase AmpD
MNTELSKRIIQVDFPDNKYYKTEYRKNQVCLHHTVSGNKVDGDINEFKNSIQNVSTCVIIDRTGMIYQLYPSKYWAYHLGIQEKDLNNLGIKLYKNLNTTCIGIEIDSWGGLVKHENGKFYPALYNNGNLYANVNAGEVTNYIEYPKGYRGFFAFEKYTNEQIESVKQLLLYWHEVYGIKLDYNEDMWDLSSKALNGVDGIWTHVSFRSDKSDCHPQPELIDMLKSLKNISNGNI